MDTILANVFDFIFLGVLTTLYGWGVLKISCFSQNLVCVFLVMLLEVLCCWRM